LCKGALFIHTNGHTNDSSSEDIPVETGCKAQHLPRVVRLMTPAPTGVAKNWAAYRARSLEPVCLRAGLRF